MEELEEISVMDVYDIVTEFAKEFRPIIEIYGPDPLNNIMSKVVTILEHLEAQTVKIGKLNALIQERDSTIVKLERDKADKAADRQRFEKELEQIEEHWKEESAEMMGMINRLQEENKKMSKSLAARQDSIPETQTQPLSPEFDIGVLQRSHACIDKLRDQLKSKDREVHAKNTEIENLTDQVSRLSLLVKDLRKRYRLSQGQVRSLIDERASFIAQLQNQHHDLQAMRKRLGVAEKENEDLSLSYNEKPDLRNKAVYDLDDPNRPRFTTDELKDILRERNEFKARVSDLEDELALYRPKNDDVLRVEEPKYMWLWQTSRLRMMLPSYGFSSSHWKKRKKKMLLFKDRSHMSPVMHLGRNQNQESENYFENFSVKLMSHFWATVLRGVCHLSPRWPWQVVPLLILLCETITYDPSHLFTINTTGCLEFVFGIYDS